jgi:hypothetical protein
MFAACGVSLLVALAALSSYSQDQLAGHWEGTIRAPQGERPTTATFKKEGETYTGVMPGLRPGTEIQLREIKVDGNKVTAKASIETPQGTTLDVNYSFTLEGDSLKGQGSLDFGGQTISFDIDLKRAASGPQAPQPGAQRPAPGASPEGQRRQRNPDVPQPQQQQSIDYFVGHWTYKYVGRESPFGPAPRDCKVTFTKRPDGKSVEGATECTHDGTASSATSVLVFDSETKMISATETVGKGVTMTSRGDWTSPIAIRFSADPVRLGGMTLQLRRTIAVVSAHSFTITDEFSENGGPFVRLGNAVVTKAAR